PYRWGLGADLAPGATTTVTGYLKITQDFKPTTFWTALVDEPGRILQEGTGMQLVTSLPENAAIVAVDGANARSEPSITSSVVGQLTAGTRVELIGKNGDWLKIRMPDQREAWLSSAWVVSAGVTA